MNWYEYNRDAIQRTYGKDWKLFCGLIACTSSNTSIKTNTTLAIRAYNQLKTTGLKASSFMRIHYNNIINYLETGQPSGRKVSRFYQNLIGNEKPVTVDIWITRHYKLKTSLTAKQYRIIEQRIQRKAKKLGISPAQLQAELWIKIRRRTDNIADYVAQLPLL